ncbi:MAG: ABC transporter ATP-binding protein [Actinomycetales bacterium]|nr:ABC transporter ATP-binding protein [Actinomycetales bacterium]
MSPNHAGRVPAISISNLTKMYGNTVGVRDISFEVMPGEVLGFLGPNGAGKTTAMRVLVGLIHATSGTARILGVDIQAANPALRADIGYLPGALELYRHLSAADLLHFLASMRRLDCSKQITSLANRLDLDLSKRLSDLSKGNRQKVGVIQAFMHQPKVLILDEPTGGLDPLVQREFEDILNSARDNGAGVLLSSHVLSEVEHLTDRVAILDRGDLLAVEHIDNLKSATTRTLDLQFEELVPPEVFSGVQGVKDVVVRGHQVTCEVAGSEHELLKVAVANGVVNVHSREVSLTEVFISLVEGNGKR